MFSRVARRLKSYTGKSQILNVLEQRTLEAAGTHARSFKEVSSRHPTQRTIHPKPFYSRPREAAAWSQLPAQALKAGHIMRLRSLERLSERIQSGHAHEMLENETGCAQI